MQLDQVNNEDHTLWVGSSVQSHGCGALGLLKAPSSTLTMQELSDTVRQKNLHSNPVNLI